MYWGRRKQRIEEEEMETDRVNSMQTVGSCQARRFLDGSGCRETRGSGFHHHTEGEEHGGEESARGERWFCG
jgi:hypothetical protein